MGLIEERILVDPLILHGKPVVRGTRLAVEFIIELLAQGWSEAEILDNYPGLTTEDIRACLAYASALLHAEQWPRLAVPWNIHQALKVKRDEILELAAKHGAGNVRIIGAAAHSEPRADQDLEILVAVEGKTSPWFPASLMVDLEELLGCKVWVVTEGGLKAPEKERVLKEAVGL